MASLSSNGESLPARHSMNSASSSVRAAASSRSYAIAARARRCLFWDLLKESTACRRLTLSSTAGGRPSSRASDCTQNSLARRRTAMLPVPVCCSVSLCGRCGTPAATAPGHASRWMSSARARGPAHALGVVPNHSVAIPIDRRACSRRAISPRRGFRGGATQSLSTATNRCASTRSPSAHQEPWFGFAHITLELSCGRPARQAAHQSVSLSAVQPLNPTHSASRPSAAAHVRRLVRTLISAE